ncbi:TetR family transcriptional regulator [Nocardioides panaciterrulae]|uniref:AcrR family transcriptional regulator n=1 Tax=Nocardioides panaciterrulae TaxID=661492 RepID=A0A7Y9E5I4_9ACTN|nr:TetR family transcriptional regulator [Nocardioides panaciterrulae]NYD41221.1 AcrR family transcriptional regulator [Nocardioides panaciterrulae]
MAGLVVPPPGPEAGARGGTRLERKGRTRRAILDAALMLSEDSGFGALSLRQVAKEVGIVPTAFYRHFDSLEALGLALVEESFESLRAMLRDIRRGDPSYADVVDLSIDTLVEHVHRQRTHFLFIARERAAGPPAVREEVRRDIELCEHDLATDLAALPGTDAWSAADLRILSNLIVTAMVATAEAILNATDPAEEQRVVGTARTQLRMVLIGALNWRSGS